MSQKLRLTISTIIALVFSTGYFLTRVFDGLIFVEQSAGAFGRTFLYTSILLVILVFVVFAVLKPRNTHGDDEIIEDERDIIIEHRGDRIGYFTLCFMLVGLLLHYVLDGMYPGSVFGDLSLATPFHWAVFITLAMFLAELVKWVSVYLMYGRQG